MVWMHREILKPPVTLEVDHINHNGLDNRKANLRPATHRQNQCNRRNNSKNTSSIYRGVSFHKKTKRWTARIKTNGYTKYLGLFKDQAAAARTYDLVAKKYHGQFAVLNFKDKKPRKKLWGIIHRGKKNVRFLPAIR